MVKCKPLATGGAAGSILAGARAGPGLGLGPGMRVWAAEGAAAATIQVERCRLTLSKPVLKPPRTKRLKLKYDKSLLKFAFKFHLRRYVQGTPPRWPRWLEEWPSLRQGLTLVHISAQPEPFMSLTH